MKKVITLLLISSVWLTNAQAFKGNGDVKGQVGLNSTRRRNRNFHFF
jgi:hypothetical protein